MKKELVVIGGGPSGIVLAKNLGKKIDMAVIRPEDHSMIYCAMPYVIENILPSEKTFKKDSLVTEAGAELIRDMVSFIDFENKLVFLEKGKTISWNKLVIATGAKPFIPPIKNADLKGVMGFKQQEDMEKLYNACQNGLKKAVIVGAGAIGIELAQALKTREVDVTLVDMAESVLANMNDIEMTNDAANQLTSKGIKIILNAKVDGFEGKQKVEQVILSNGSKISLTSPDNCTETNSNNYGIVVFAAGVRPEVSVLGQNSPVKTGKDGIIINEYMETNVKDVFACGDCAEFQSGITGKVISGKLATNAVPMAKILADNILGKKRKYTGFFNGAATKVGDFYIGGTGLTEKNALLEGFDIIIGYSELTTQFPIMPDAQILKLKLVAKKENGQIIGGQIFSGSPATSQIDLITFAIQQKATIYDLRDLSYSAQPYQSFFPANNIFVQACSQMINDLEK